MKSSTADYAIVYDISDSKERDRLHKLLKGYGFNVQKSVFECRLTKYTCKQLKKRIISLQITSGYLKMYRIMLNTLPFEIGNNPMAVDDFSPLFIC